MRVVPGPAQNPWHAHLLFMDADNCHRKHRQTVLILPRDNGAEHKRQGCSHAQPTPFRLSHLQLSPNQHSPHLSCT